MKDINFFKKKEIECELDALLCKSLILFSESDGITCKKCGIIQGRPYLGWNKYYCEHIDNKIKNKLKERKRELIQKLLNL